MPKVFEGTDKEFYMDGYLMENLNALKGAVKRDWDGVVVVDGYEGTGKSFCTAQCAFYCDPSLTMDRVTFTPEGFIKAIKESKKFQSVILDEAYGGLSSRGTMTKINKSIVKVLTEIRQKNLFVFIVLPSFFELDKYVAIHRSRALIHVYANEKMQRGFFRFYSMSRKKSLYMSGKKFYSYGGVKSNFFGRFVNHFPLDLDAYKAKKLKKTQEAEAETSQEKRQRIVKEERLVIVKNLRDYYAFTYKEIGKVLEVTERTIANYMKEID